MRAGFLAAVAAALLWGLFPLYWPLLEPAGPLEILAHRVFWSLTAMVLVLTVTRRWRVLAGLTWRTAGLTAAAALLISVNWGVYIFAVNSGAVLDAALGYFVTPLLSVLLGRLVLREHVRTGQLGAVALGSAAVVVIAASGGRFPWIALVLAASFSTYGLIKKIVPLVPQASMTAESAVLALPAVIYLAVLQGRGAGTMTDHGAGHLVLLMVSGVVTVVPLLLFAAATRRLPLSVLGPVQFLTPAVQFLLGLFYAHEQVSPARWIGFVLIWLGLGVFVLDQWRARRATAGRAPGGDPVESVGAVDHETGQREQRIARAGRG